jgi:hypothetical protein
LEFYINTKFQQNQAENLSWLALEMATKEKTTFLSIKSKNMAINCPKAPNYGKKVVFSVVAISRASQEIFSA